MEICESIDNLRMRLKGREEDIVFVPTMGNIHEGHLSLIEIGKKHGKFIVCSIFINPLQFDDVEDFRTYPRTIYSDIEKLSDAEVNVLFLPSEEVLFPQPQVFFVVPPDNLSKILEGYFRKDFFIGVTTIVLKLLQCARPKVAVFGKKDFQQALILEKMCSQFQIPTEIILGETVREDDGLAVSSRNSKLSKTERVDSAYLYKVMEEAVFNILALHDESALNKAEIAKIESSSMNKLFLKGWKPEYFAVRVKSNLEKPFKTEGQKVIVDDLIILTAAWIGVNRLIDNLEIGSKSSTKI